MSLLGSILKTGFDVLTTPVDLVKDVVTLGGAMTDEEPALLKKVKTLGNDLENIGDDLADL